MRLGEGEKEEEGGRGVSWCQSFAGVTYVSWQSTGILGRLVKELLNI